MYHWARETNNAGPLCFLRTVPQLRLWTVDGCRVDACTGVDTFCLFVRSPEPKVIEMEDNEDWLTSTVVQLDKCKFSSM